LGGFLHPIALALDFDEVGVVQEAVEYGGGSWYVSDEFTPFFEGSVGGHQGGAHFVAAHNDLEEVFAGLGWELGDAHVIDDKEVAFEVAFHGALMTLVEAVVAEVGQEVEDGAVEHDFSGFDQLMADGLCEMTFTHSGRADQEDVFDLIQEASGGQVVDLPAVDAGVKAEVKAVEGAPLAEGGGLVSAFDLALLAHVQFVL